MAVYEYLGVCGCFDVCYDVRLYFNEHGYQGTLQKMNVTQRLFLPE